MFGCKLILKHNHQLRIPMEKLYN